MPATLSEFVLGGAVFFVYVWLCNRVALYAQRKGERYVLFFVIGFLTSPVVSGLIAFFVHDPIGDDPS